MRENLLLGVSFAISLVGIWLVFALLRAQSAEKIVELLAIYAAWSIVRNLASAAIKVERERSGE